MLSFIATILSTAIIAFFVSAWRGRASAIAYVQEQQDRRVQLLKSFRKEFPDLDSYLAAGIKESKEKE